MRRVKVWFMDRAQVWSRLKGSSALLKCANSPLARYDSEAGQGASLSILGLGESRRYFPLLRHHSARPICGPFVVNWGAEAFGSLAEICVRFP